MFVAGSIFLNIVLSIALAVVVFRARTRIVEEKAATFAGCLGAIIDGLARNDLDERAKMTALGLKRGKGKPEYEELTWRLVRAGFMRSLRGELALADVGGEHVRELTLRAIAGNKDGEAEAEEVWHYIDGALDRRDGFEQEPRERFGDSVLSRAQYYYEAEILGFYYATLQENPPKLFG